MKKKLGGLTIYGKFYPGKMGECEHPSVETELDKMVKKEMGRQIEEREMAKAKRKYEEEQQSRPVPKIDWMQEYAKETPPDSVYYIHYDYKDEETKKLLAEKEKLEKELERINTRLENKTKEVNLLDSFEKNKWYEYFDGAVTHIYFKIGSDDFIRDGSLWLHTSFIENVMLIKSSITFDELTLMDVELLKPDYKDRFTLIDDSKIKDKLNYEIEKIKGLING